MLNKKIIKIHFLQNLKNRIRNSNMFSKLKSDFCYWVNFSLLIGLFPRKNYHLSTALINNIDMNANILCES